MVLISFDSWWVEQGAIEKIYWLVTIPASLIFLVQLALSFRSAEPKISAANSSDSSTRNETKITFQPINFRNFMGFCTALGWSGLACIDSGLSTESTILTSFACALAMLFTLATIFYILEKLMTDIRENLD